MANASLRSPSIIDIGNAVQSKEFCIKFMRKHRFLRKASKCFRCNTDMTLISKPQKVITDRQMWLCSNCISCKSIWHGTVFAVSIITNEWLFFQFQEFRHHFMIEIYIFFISGLKTDIRIFIDGLLFLLPRHSDLSG